MKDRGSNLEEVLKSLLSVTSNDRIVLFQTPQGRANNVSDGGSQGSQSAGECRTKKRRVCFCEMRNCIENGMVCVRSQKCAQGLF